MIKKLKGRASISLLTTCYLLLATLLCACSKSDPILPGHREPVFPQSAIKITNRDVPDNVLEFAAPTESPYIRDADNKIKNDDRTIYTGLPGPVRVGGNHKTAIDGNNVYAGLSTGEAVRVTTGGRIVWTADIHSRAHMGGSSVLDISATPVVVGNFVYVGGMGDAFCKLNKNNGNEIWCANIGTAFDFAANADVAIVCGTDNGLYALNAKTGDAYWRTQIDKCGAVKMNGKNINIGREEFSAINGEKLK
ncbi:MAG: PQQ-like beta-propeller repeat protein [Rickettsiales bacterium]|jgi:outer membrane protein assembly factor BamB|nr:PQQ-like beta-propeller repeat protein [Rickettsiales bacterium]